MCNNEIEHETTRIAIRVARPKNSMFGMVAQDSDMMNVVICIPHLPCYSYDPADNYASLEQWLFVESQGGCTVNLG